MTPVGNRLLAALPERELQRLSSGLERTECRPGSVLVESGRSTDYVHFPTTCVAALVHTMADGSASGKAIVGNEGLTGVGALLGGEPLPGRLEVQVAGAALRMRTAPALEQFRRGGPFQELLLRYTHALLTQVSQIAACRSVHAAEQRLARLLLLIHDRSGSRELPLTQQSLATMIGVRRESVSHVVARLQNGNGIRHSRGLVRIVDRPALQRAACECYEVISNAYEAVLTTASARFDTRSEGRYSLIV